MNKGKGERIRERIVLGIYIVYVLITSAISIYLHWDNWIAPFMLVGMAVCIIMHIKEFRGFYFRAVIVSVLLWANASIYVFKLGTLIGGIPILASVIVLTSAYCIPDVLAVSLASYTIHVVYFLFFAHDFEIVFTTAEGIGTLVSVFAVYIITTIAFIMTKTQSEMNTALINTIKRLLGTESSKDDFLANVSHEIRTPINTVCGLSEMVLRRDLPDDLREDILDIRNSGKSLLAIVSDILDFSELSSDKMEIIPTTYNITSTLNDVISMTESAVLEKGLELIVDCDPMIPSGLIGDEQKIRRAFMNVIDNAVKFTDEGGILVSVRARREEYGVNLIITVRDTGIGMDEKTIEKLFTSYNQVDTKRNRQECGLGLGLPITKAIVNKMNGFISVSSEEGKGTKVQLIIPQEIASEEPAVVLEGHEKVKTLLYINMNKYRFSSVRDGYRECIDNIIKGLRVKCISATSLMDFKRRLEKESFTHAFISWEEYCEDKDYFEELAGTMRVVVVLNRDHKESFAGSGLSYVYKPFYILPIAAALSGNFTDSHAARQNTRFIAPDAAVLVVDDNRMNLKVIEGLLRPYRVQVHVAENGRDALKMLDSLRIDIVFMDHMMPEIDGVETFHEIKRKTGSFFQSLPVIALTANAIGGAREMFIKEGFADYLTKPIELSALERVLARFIPANKIIKYSDAVREAAKQEENTNDGTLSIEGVDVEMGIGYCSGSTSDYIDVIKIYYEIGVKRVDEIRAYFEEKDWENYTILVHAVKSTSLNIGAVKLSNMAKRLETAGKEKRERIIVDETSTMLAEYERVLGAIRNCKAVGISGKSTANTKAKNEALKEITEEELMEHLERLSVCLSSYEIETVESYTESLRGYSYMGIGLGELLAEIVEKVNVFDFMGAEEELKKLTEKLR